MTDGTAGIVCFVCYGTWSQYAYIAALLHAEVSSGMS